MLGLNMARAQADKAPEWELGVSIPMNQKQLEQNIAWAGEAGIKWLEVDLIGGFTTDKEEMKKRFLTYKAAADKAGMKIWSIHIPYGNSYDPSEADPAKREKCRDNILKVLESARVLGPYKKAILHPSYEPIREEDRAAKLEALKNELDELGPLVEKKYNVRLAMECLPRTCLMNTSAETMDILKGRPSLDNCFDTNHLLQEKPEDYVKAVGKRIGAIHVSDYDNINERHWIPGKQEGVIDWVAVVRELKKAGYSGPFLFEVTPTPWADNMKKFYEDLVQSWEKIKKDYEAEK